jgi:hypothetical protein
VRKIRGTMRILRKRKDKDFKREELRKMLRRLESLRD